MFFTSTVTLVSCIFYVVGTYVSQNYVLVLVTVEAIFAVVFFVDYVLSAIAEAVSLPWNSSPPLSLLIVCLCPCSQSCLCYISQQNREK